jgi:DNA-binding NtrC family response regulator
MDGVGRALIVEDDPTLASALEAFVGKRAKVVVRATTKADALLALEDGPVDVLLLDIALPDGSGIEVLAAATSRAVFPRVIVISGSADADTAFRLAQAGTRCFVTKPLDLAKLQEAWDRALLGAPDLGPFIRACIGRRRLRDLEAEVRRQMTDEALAVGHGSRHKASAILGISRQLLQRILRNRN